MRAPTGLIIEVQLKVRAGTLYQGTLVGAREDRVDLPTVMLQSNKEATAHFHAHALKYFQAPAWASGDGVDKRMARRLGMEVRQRAPGAGRKRGNPDEEKAAKPYTYRLPIAVGDAIKAEAKLRGISQGDVIAHRFPIKE